MLNGRMRCWHDTGVDAFRPTSYGVSAGGRCRNARVISCAVVVVLFAAVMWVARSDAAPPHQLVQPMYLSPKITGARWMYDRRLLPKPGRVADLSQWGDENQVLNSHDAAADLRDLPDLLMRTYGRYGDYAQAGLNVRELTERRARFVLLTQSITAGTAFGPVYSVLQTAVPDQHLRLNIAGLYDRIMSEPVRLAREFRGPPSTLESASKVSGAAWQTAEVIHVLGDDAKFRLQGSVSVIGNASDLALANLGYVSQQRSAPDSTLESTQDPAYRLTRHGNTCFVRLATLDAVFDHKSVLRFVRDAERVKKCSTAILDLRGNSGGFELYVDAWMYTMGWDSSRKDVVRTSAVDSNIESNVTAWNSLQYNTKYLSGDLGSTYLAGQEDSLSGLWPLTTATKPPRGAVSSSDSYSISQRWPGNLVVLVDRHTASAGEWSAVKLKLFMGACIVGERTAGFMGSSGVLPYQLSRTGVRWIVPYQKPDATDTRSGERIGIPVDIGLASPGASEDEIVALLPALRRCAPP